MILTPHTNVALISVYGTREPEKGMYHRRLYELLEERKPWQSISHKSLPTYADHVLFVESRPYSAWYVIYDGCDFIGSVYLTSLNEIGLFIKEGKERKGYGKSALQALMLCHPKPFYLANIAPGNSNSIAFFSNMGFKHHATTYADDKDGSMLQFTHKFIPPPLSYEPGNVSDEPQSATPDLPTPVRECQ